MIKILYIINDFRDISLNHNAFKIADSLPRDRFTAYILALENNGLLKHRFFTTFRHKLFISDKSFFHGVSRTADIIKKYGIGIVHTQTLRADYTLFFAKILLPLDQIKIFHAANRRNYLFLTCEPNFLLKNILYFVSCHLADFNICVARHLRRKLMTRLMVPKSKIAVIPNGVDPLNIVEKKNKINNPPLITYTGQLVKRKNLMLLLKALTQVTVPFKCLIIGGGPEKQKLEEFAQAKKLGSRVRFQPFTPNVSKFLAKTDIFVLPSLAEGMSMSLLEAMSFGIACVVSDIDANTELIKHMENSLIFPKDNIKDLSGDLNLLLYNYKLRKRLGSNAKRKIENDYCLSDTLKRYLRIYSAAACN